jgi:tRNA(Ile)-lysidine synthase
MNPRAVEALARTMRVLAEDDALLDRLAAKELLDLERTEGNRSGSRVEGSVAIDRVGLDALDPAFARRVVRLAVERVFPEASRQELGQLDAVVADLTEVGSRRDLPGGVHASVEHDALLLEAVRGETSPLASALLEVPGSVRVDGGVVRADVEEGPSAGIDADADDADVEYVDADRLENALTVGGPREGERMRPLGMAGTKKLSDVLMDAKVPARLRSRVPVVRDGDRVVWVAGVRLSEAYRVAEDTRRVVRLAYTRER